MNRIARGGSRGVSLVELCVGAGVLALLAGAAIPALTQFRREQALRAAADALASDLRLARSEAARTGGLRLLSRQRQRQPELLPAPHRHGQRLRLQRKRPSFMHDARQRHHQGRMAASRQPAPAQQRRDFRIPVPPGPGHADRQHRPQPRQRPGYPPSRRHHRPRAQLLHRSQAVRPAQMRLKRLPLVHGSGDQRSFIGDERRKRNDLSVRRYRESRPCPLRPSDASAASRSSN